MKWGDTVVRDGQELRYMQVVTVQGGSSLIACLKGRESALINFWLGMLEAATSLVAFGQHPEAQLMNQGPCHRDCCVTWSLLKQVEQHSDSHLCQHKI